MIRSGEYRSRPLPDAQEQYESPRSSAATATADRIVKYTVTVEINGRTYTTETGNITVPGTATGDPGQTDQPSNPGTPSQGGKGKWCGEDHSGNFWQRIVGFFHSILYFFAHLFRLR